MAGERGGEKQRLAVGRPDRVPRTVLQVGELPGFAAIGRQDVDLRFVAAAIGDKCDLAAVG